MALNIQIIHPNPPKPSGINRYYKIRQMNQILVKLLLITTLFCHSCGMTEDFGPVIQTIDFKLIVTNEDLTIFKDGFIHWVSIDSPEINSNKLVDADKIILPYQSVKIYIDYPLNHPASFVIKTNEMGFTRRQLITEISGKYHQIYKLEETTADTKTTPVDQRQGLVNRNETDGKYGIWGHDISDLDLSTIEVHKNKKGEITLILGIES
jgi:hypothetical protein